jgi:demethylmenaquinone methyltransferase/2-methoxy-6-polyprenyl-1,4-benzoquinol methylase
LSERFVKALLAARRGIMAESHGIWWLVAVAALAVSLLIFRRTGDGDASGAALGSGMMFDRIAPFYDLANKFMSLNMDQSWRRVLVDELELSRTEPLNILDIATGTGDVCILMAKKVRQLGNEAKTSIVALDPSPRMLDFARVKRSAEGFDNLITLQVGNAEEAEDLLQSGKLFNKMTISFGIRNFSNRQKALSAMRQALKHSHSSQLLILEFANPERGPLAPLARLFLQYAVPLLGSLVAGGHNAEYDHLRDSILNFPSPENFVAEMAGAGFKDCQAKNVFFDVVYLFACRG